MSLNLSSWQRATVLLFLAALTFMIVFGRPSSPALTVAVKPLPAGGDFMLPGAATASHAATATPLPQDRPRPARWAFSPLMVHHRRRKARHRHVLQPVSAPAPAPVPPPAPMVTAGAAPVGAIQSYAESLVGPVQFVCLQQLWDRESGWQWNAANPSGAYGIPQALPGGKMAVAGSDWQTNPMTQVKWGVLDYIDPTYGNACNAWAHEEASGWY